MTLRRVALSRVLTVSLALVIGVLLAMACASSSESFAELEDDYKACVSKYIERHYGEEGNRWLIDEFVTRRTVADSSDDMRRLRDLCRSSLECPPTDFGRGLCSSSEFSGRRNADEQHATL